MFDKMNKNQKYLLGFAICVAVILLILVILLALRDRAAAPVQPTREVPTTLTPMLIASPTPTPVGIPVTKPTNTPQATATQVNPPQSDTPLPTAAGPQVFYAAVDGSPNNNGSQGQPWSLQFALDQPFALRPGDTLWLRGGQYVGTFTSHLKGAEGKPITVRAYPGERATLANDTLVLDIATSSYVNFWGLEITATVNNRDPETRPDSGYGVRINQGEESHNIKFINMIVHDMPAQGFGWWQANTNSEIYGSLVYFNGVTQLDHGIYVHNNTGEKRLIDNLVFDNASHGIHAYGEKDYQGLNNLYIVGNTLFDNGSIGFSTRRSTYGDYQRNILVGGVLLLAENPVITDNYTYYPDSSGESLNLGYRSGSKNAVVENNYFAGGQVTVGGQNDGLQMLQNTIMGVGLRGIGQLGMVGNDLIINKPNDTRIFVRPNQYEPGRANITIYNWNKQESITLLANDLKGIQIQPGDIYELHNAQDFYADIITGTYDGNQIVIPMTNRTVAQPLGLSFKPASTFPEFGVFVLITRPGS